MGKDNGLENMGNLWMKMFSKSGKLLTSDCLFITSRLLLVALWISDINLYFKSIVNSMSVWFASSHRSAAGYTSVVK